MRIVAALLLGFSLASVALADLGTDPREVYGRLIAPCCWNQTLDIHDSEIATVLRVEIAERLARGDDPLAIEDDLASRFGERIRAVPRAQDPRQSMALFAFGGMAAALLALFVLARRWSARDVDLNVQALEEHSEYDAQLDRELSK